MTGEGRKGDRPLSRDILSSQVKDRILQWILEGELVPGSRLVETRVARELNVSQSPVREAIRDLAALGFLEVEPFRGASVRAFTREEFVEDMEIRGEIEALAARRAALNITPEEIAAMEGLVAEMLKYAELGDAHGQSEVNTQFHWAVVRASRSKTLERVWSLLEPYARTYLTATVPGSDLAWLGERHHAIIEALRMRDPDEAAAAMVRHSEEAKEVLLSMDQSRFLAPVASADKGVPGGT